MKLSMAVTPAFVLALALSAAAQEKPVTTRKDNTDTVKVSVSGNAVLDYIYRSRGITSMQQAVNQDSENTFEGELGVRFDVEMSDKVALVLEIGRERVDGTFDTFGNAGAEDIVLRELRVIIGDFLTPGLQFQVGIPEWEFNVRGKGGAVAFAPRRSESAYNNISTFEDVAGTMAGRAGNPNELDPVGFVFKYVREQLQLDVVLLPAVIEGGEMSDDESLWAVDVLYSLDNKGSRIGGILALMGSPGSPSTAFTFGGGAAWNGIDSLELFAEVYFQFGDIAEAGADEVDLGGLALRVGGMWTAQGGTFSVGAMIDLRSGDGDTAGGTDDTVDSFISYESINDLLILEDQYFGLDWDTNILAIKFLAELPLQVKQKNDLILSAILGICRTNEDVQFASGEDALGNEIDVRARWSVTKQAALNAAIAFLLGSDILEESMGGSANDDSDDSAFIFTFGADLRF